MRKLRAYYNVGVSKCYIKTFGDGTDITKALDEARAWCEENCEDKGVMDYYYENEKIWLEEC
jgi:hypothetical protein